MGENLKLAAMGLVVSGAMALDASLDLTAVSTALTSSMNVSTIMEVIGLTIAGGLTMNITWWGARKLFKTISRTFKGGRLKI